MWVEGRDYPLCLGARLIDETGGEESAATAQRATTKRVWRNDKVARACEHTLGRSRVVGFEIAVEGVDQQHDVGPVVTPVTLRPLGGEGGIRAARPSR